MYMVMILGASVVPVWVSGLSAKVSDVRYQCELRCQVSACAQCEGLRFYSHLIGKALPERVDHFRVHTKGGAEASVAHNVRGLGKKEEGSRTKDEGRKKG